MKNSTLGDGQSNRKKGTKQHKQEDFKRFCTNIIFFPLVNNYINIFGIGQFVGVIFAPVLGPYIDRIPKLSKNASYEDYRIWKIKRCAVALRITCTINIIMGISVLVPILEAQVSVYSFFARSTKN